jgi:excisionase family DNA binding protein
MLLFGGATIRPVKEDDLLTIQAAARELSVSHMTIRRWIEAGHLHPIRPGREYLILREELDRFRDPQARPRPGRPRSKSAD